MAEVRVAQDRRVPEVEERLAAVLAECSKKASIDTQKIKSFANLKQPTGD